MGWHAVKINQSTMKMWTRLRIIKIELIEMGGKKIKLNKTCT